MTDQEIFDKVLNHCRAQGVAAIDASTRKCAYRAQGGLKCAVGCLIPDNAYTPNIEGDSVKGLFSPAVADSYAGLRRVLDESGIAEDQWGLLEQLQTAHDNDMPRTVGGDMGRFESEMRLIADERGLVYKEKTQ